MRLSRQLKLYSNNFIYWEEFLLPLFFLLKKGQSPLLNYIALYPNKYEEDFNDEFILGTQDRPLEEFVITLKLNETINKKKNTSNVTKDNMNLYLNDIL